MSSITIEHLAKRPDLLPKIQKWFESEWPAYYGPGGQGDAQKDLLGYSNLNALPMGIVADRGGEECGFAAIKTDPFPTHTQLFPWAGAAYVKPSLRRKGIGRELLLALEPEARSLGYERLYGATATSASLLLRCGWRLLERVVHEGEDVGIYQKKL